MNILSKLSDTLNELMILRGLDEQTLAQKTGIPISCISSYVRGLQLPYVDTLLKLADYFKCSVDYLVGNNDMLCEKDYGYNSTFAERFNQLLKAHNCATYKSFNVEGISKSSFYEWKRGQSLPTLEKLIKIAKYFDCSLDFIVGRTEL